MSDSEFYAAALLLAIAMKRKKRKLKKKLKLHKEIEVPMEFGQSLKISTKNFEEMLQKISPFVTKKSTIIGDAITPAKQLSLTLHYLGTGLSFRKLLFASKITASASTSCKSIIETCEALIKALKYQIILPSNSTDWKIQANAFNEIWNFPNCLGALGGRNINITQPHESAAPYQPVKEKVSLVILALVNALHEFIAVDVGIRLNTTDNNIFNQSKLYHKLNDSHLNIPKPEKLPNSEKQIPFVFVSDNAFPLMENIINAYDQKSCEKRKIIFNYRLERAHRTVENAFGLMASRFRVLLGTIHLTPQEASVVVLTCCYLHNFLLKSNDRNYLRNGFDIEDTKTATFRYADRHDDGVHLTKMQPHRNNCNLPLPNSRITGKCSRNTLCDYFMNKGVVAWQDEVHKKNYK